MNKRRDDGRETWNRLLDWDKGQTPSERLAATLLTTEGFTKIDPSHPLGGKDSGKDALLRKEGLDLLLAVYFPRGQVAFGEIKSKFKDDYQSAKKNNAEGFVFFTNQELRLAERSQLNDIAAGTPIDIYHLERIATLLNSPVNYGIRLEFLQITMTNEELIALYSERDLAHLAEISRITETLKTATESIIGFTTGGDSFAYYGLVGGTIGFDGLRLCIQHVGDYDLHDLSIEVNSHDAHTFPTDMTQRDHRGFITATKHVNRLENKCILVGGELHLDPDRDHVFGIEYVARNGRWRQDIKWKKINLSWEFATVVWGTPGNVRDVSQPLHAKRTTHFPIDDLPHIMKRFENYL